MQPTLSMTPALSMNAVPSSGWKRRASLSALFAGLVRLRRPRFPVAAFAFRALRVALNGAGPR